jgi:hypothetical protein
VSHDTRVLVDSDIYDMVPGTTDFIKVGTFDIDNVTSMVALTTSKILVAYQS